MVTTQLFGITTEDHENRPLDLPPHSDSEFWRKGYGEAEICIFFFFKTGVVLISWTEI